MTDAEGREAFSFVPGSKTGDRPVTFVLPDLLADPKSFGV